MRLRLTDRLPPAARAHHGRWPPSAQDFDEILAARLQEADEFYRSVTPPSARADEAHVMRQALAGMLWSKQYYYFDVDQWLEEHQADPLHRRQPPIRNREWFHMVNEDIISMPDKWEYPWYAAWDLAFHTLPLSIVDPDFAKQQLELMLREHYLHPNGQIPAYEWNFSDVNPPVHAWATLFLYRTEQAAARRGRRRVPQAAFGKLLLNFTWWVNRKDRFGKNVFEGGFLGLDNIGVFDRSAPLPTGGYLEQADGTAWMALFTPEHARDRRRAGRRTIRIYEDMASKFVEHFLLDRRGHEPRGRDGMWDEEDGFYYDVLRLPDGSATRLKVRSMVGLLPLCATTVIETWQRERVPRATARVHGAHAADARAGGDHPSHRPGPPGRGRARHLALVNPERLRRILGPDAGRERVPEPLRHPLALEVPRASTLYLPRATARSTASTTCRRSRTPACSAATPTGGGRSGCRSTS